MSTMKGSVGPVFSSGPNELSSELVACNSKSRNRVSSSSLNPSLYHYATSVYESTDNDNDDMPFCTNVNVEDCVSYLNQVIFC